MNEQLNEAISLFWEVSHAWNTGQTNLSTEQGIKKLSRARDVAYNQERHALLARIDSLLDEIVCRSVQLPGVNKATNK